MTGSSYRNYDLDVRARQSNSMDDGDDNLSRAIITQETTGSTAGNHHGYGGHSSRDNAAEVYQETDSGSNEQRNKLYVNDPEARDDLTLDLGQSNGMDDDDRNTNYANVEQTAARGGSGYHGGHGSSGDNWADIDQSIDSGSNYQKNYASIDDARAGDDLLLTLRQSNSMDDGDRNGNFSEVAQEFEAGNGGGSTAHSYGGHGGGSSGDNDADIDQSIDSGSNRQKNYADLDDMRSRGDLDVDVAQGNTMHDDDLNTNGSTVEQTGGRNWADVYQNIDSGSNHQSNNVDFDPSGSYSSLRGNDYGYGGGHGGGHGSSGGDIEVDLVQRNWMDDGDDNMNDSEVIQVGGRGADNDATTWQGIHSGGNSQSNRADLDVGGRGAAGEYDVEQVNWMADDDVNTNQSNIEQRSVDNWADVDQHIDSGSNTQHNSLDLDFG